METFVDKFNIFDLFTMLIPGIIISTLSAVSLSFVFYDKWKSCGNEKYAVFFIVSYLYGLILQQIGTIIDQKIAYYFLYGGNPKRIFLFEDKYQKVFDNKFAYDDAVTIKKYVIKHLHINTKNIKNTEQKEQLNSHIFSYCLSVVEKNGLSYKADKMFVISEMSRSLSLGCMLVIILNLFICLFNRFDCFVYNFYLIEIPILLILSKIFLNRKIQYEQYRFRIVLKMFLIYIKDK